MITSSRITFRFRQSRAKALAWLLALAQRGEFRQQALAPGQTIYESTFDIRDPQQLIWAFSLATGLIHEKTAEALVAGQTIALPMAREVLRCYQQSGQVEDRRAYCYVRHAFSDDPNPTTFFLDLTGEKRWLFPCRCAIKQMHSVHPDHPAPIRDQVEAALVRGQSWWCPRLNLDEWEPIQWIRPLSSSKG